MNAYRVALILCRAVSVTLWWTAGIRFVSVGATLLAAKLGAWATSVFPVGMNIVLPSLITVVPLVIAAIFLQVFTASISASMIGRSSFEGEVIASRHKLDAIESGLARAGAGLLLLFFNGANLFPTILAAGYTLIFQRPSAPLNGSIQIYQLVTSIVPLALFCLVGFVLAFAPSLRRAVQSP